MRKGWWSRVPRERTKAQQAHDRRLAAHGHPFVCSKCKTPTAKQAAKGRWGSRCGRVAVVLWCRVEGSGSAMIPRCKAHEAFDPHDWNWEKPEQESDFVAVKPTEYEEFRKAKRVRFALRERADEV